MDIQHEFTKLMNENPAVHELNMFGYYESLSNPSGLLDMLTAEATSYDLPGVIRKRFPHLIRLGAAIRKTPANFLDMENAHPHFLPESEFKLKFWQSSIGDISSCGPVYARFNMGHSISKLLDIPGPDAQATLLNHFKLTGSSGNIKARILQDMPFLRFAINDLFASLNCHGKLSFRPVANQAVEWMSGIKASGPAGALATLPAHVATYKRLMEFLDPANVPSAFSSNLIAPYSTSPAEWESKQAGEYSLSLWSQHMQAISRFNFRNYHAEIVRHEEEGVETGLIYAPKGFVGPLLHTTPVTLTLVNHVYPVAGDPNDMVYSFVRVKTDTELSEAAFAKANYYLRSPGDRIQFAVPKALAQRLASFCQIMTLISHSADNKARGKSPRWTSSTLDSTSYAAVTNTALNQLRSI